MECCWRENIMIIDGERLGEYGGELIINLNYNVILGLGMGIKL